MGWKAKAQGGVLAFIGFILSPLSWWNDAFVNLPLAVAFGWLVALVYRPAFEAAVVVGYWLTNVAGLVMMQKGVARTLGHEAKAYTGRAFARDVAISVGYTVLIVVLLRLKVFQPLHDYFRPKA